MQMYFFCIITNKNHAEINGKNGLNAGIQSYPKDIDNTQ